MFVLVELIEEIQIQMGAAFFSPSSWDMGNLDTYVEMMPHQGFIQLV